MGVMMVIKDYTNCDEEGKNDQNDANCDDDQNDAKKDIILCATWVDQLFPPDFEDYEEKPMTRHVHFVRWV